MKHVFILLFMDICTIFSIDYYKLSYYEYSHLHLLVHGCPFLLNILLGSSGSIASLGPLGNKTGLDDAVRF